MKKVVLTDDTDGGHPNESSSGCGGSCGGPPSRKTKAVFKASRQSQGVSPAADIKSSAALAPGASPKPTSLEAEIDNNTNATDIDSKTNATNNTNATDNTTDAAKETRDEQDSWAKPAPVVCDLTKATKSRVLERKIDRSLVRYVRAKSPVADYLRLRGPEYQRIPRPAEYVPKTVRSLLGGGKDAVSNDWAFTYLKVGASGTCVRADKARAQQLAKEWEETRRKRSPRTKSERGFEGNATLKSILVHDATTAMFALELMRPTSCDLAAQHEAASGSDSEAAQPAWVLVGTAVGNIISALLFTNGQLAGTNYLARKGINFHPGLFSSKNSAYPIEHWLYPTVTFASPLSWFEKEWCGKTWGSRQWTRSLTEFAPDSVVIVGDVVDVTGLAFKLKSSRRKRFPASNWAIQCERMYDRINIRGVIVLTSAIDRTRRVNGVREALLEVQKVAKKSYDLALSTQKQFQDFVKVKLSPVGTQGPIPAQKIMAWQKEYRLDKETLKCEGDE
eukprot:g6507.t1